LSIVFHIVDEKLREPVKSPADKIRRLGTIVGLANHTILIGKEGVETAIDGSGAPIWDDEGSPLCRLPRGNHFGQVSIILFEWKSSQRMKSSAF
jgi:hypothetical protein